MKQPKLSNRDRETANAIQAYRNRAGRTPGAYEIATALSLTMKQATARMESLKKKQA